MSSCSVKASICNVCDKKIDGKVITALNKKWHPEHFACNDCKKPIESTFNEKDGKVICSDCFTVNHTSRCKGCSMPIVGTVIKAMGASWHEEHFACEKCKKPFGKGTFMEHEGKPYCDKCHVDLFADKCAGCYKPIEAKAIIAFDKKWHSGCFKCCKCSKPITEKSFAVQDDKPLCAKCSG